MVTLPMLHVMHVNYIKFAFFSSDYPLREKESM